MDSILTSIRPLDVDELIQQWDFEIEELKKFEKYFSELNALLTKISLKKHSSDVFLNKYNVYVPNIVEMIVDYVGQDGFSYPSVPVYNQHKILIVLFIL